MGTPCSGPGEPPFITADSAVRASATARSPTTVQNALMRGFTLSIRARTAFVASTGEIFFERIAEASSVALIQQRSSGVIGISFTPCGDHALRKIQEGSCPLTSKTRVNLTKPQRKRCYGRGHRGTSLEVVVVGGAPGRSRTCDPRIRSSAPVGGRRACFQILRSAEALRRRCVRVRQIARGCECLVTVSVTRSKASYGWFRGRRP